MNSSSIFKIISGVLMLIILMIGCEHNNSLEYIDKLETDNLNLKIDLKSNENINSVETDVQYIHDTVSKAAPPPIIIYKDSLITVPAKVDTNKIIESFFTFRNEQFHFDDSLINFNSWYHVYKNQVNFDSIRYDVFRKTKVVSSVVKVSVHKWRWGGGVSISQPLNIGYTGLYLHANLSTRGWNIGTGYDPFRKSILISIDRNWIRL